MKTAFYILCLTFFPIFNASAADQITMILEANHGVAVGHSALYNESCRIRVYKPGEYTPDNAYYIEYNFDDSPVYHVAPYPNNGMIFDWALDEKKGVLIAYVSKDKNDYAQFAYDTKTLKIRSFLLPGISCENLKWPNSLQ